MIDLDRLAGWMDGLGLAGQGEPIDIDYYLILAKWKLAVVLEQGFQRAGDDFKLQSFGPIVLDLMRDAAELAESTEYGHVA